jgi:hypothetical protein
MEGTDMTEHTSRWWPRDGRARLLALALVASLAVGWLWPSNPLGGVALAEHDPDRIACSRVYDTVACSCAAAATARDEPIADATADALSDGETSPWRPADGRVAAGSNPQPVVRRVGVGRLPMTADFVRRVQACMAGGASVPID